MANILRPYGYYIYPPSKGAAGLFLALFLILLLLKSFYFIKFYYKTSRSSPELKLKLKLKPISPTQTLTSSSIEEDEPDKKFRINCCSPSIPIIFGIVLEFVGYISRIISISHHGLNIFIVSLVFILVAPSFIAGGIYMTFGRIKDSLNAHEYAFIRSKHLTSVLVLIDLITTLIIGAAGTLMAERETADLGFKLCLGAFGAQLALFALFIFMTGRFLFLLKKNPNNTVLSIKDKTNIKINWEQTLIILIAAMAWIIVRCILRLIEFAQKYDGVLARHEAAYYTIDALPVLLATALLSIKEYEKVLWNLKHLNVEPETAKA